MAYKINKTFTRLGKNMYEVEINGRKYKRRAENPYPEEYLIKRGDNDPWRKKCILDICQALEISDPYDIKTLTDAIHNDAEFDLIIPALQGGGGANIKNLRRRHPKKEYMMEEIFNRKKEKLIKGCIEFGISEKAIEEIREKKFEKYPKEYFLTMMKEELFLDLYLLAKTGQKRAEEIVKLFEWHPYYK